MPSSSAATRHAQEIARDCLASRARHLDRLLARIYDRALRGHGVTAAQLGMLVAVELSAPTTAAALGRLLEMEKSTVSRNLARLTAARFVDAADGLRITAGGAAMIRECHPAWRSAQREAAAVLGVKRRQLLGSMTGPGSIIT